MGESIVLIMTSSGIRPSIPPADPVSDYETSFPATENPISEGGKWLNGETDAVIYGDVQSISGYAMADRYVGVDDGYPDSTAIIDPSFRDFGADHWVEITIYHDPAYTPTDSHECIIILRGSVDGDGPNYLPQYHCLFTLSGFQLFWVEGSMGSFHEITVTTHNGGLVGLATGDVLRGEVEGTSLSFYQNGTLRFTATDANIATGNPGLAFWVRENGGQDYSKFCVSDFACGSL